jgi:hypothetical protein
MNKKVMTRLGPGEIVKSSSSRGHTDHLVVGDGFEVWVKDAELMPFLQDDLAPDNVDYDNSTTLPYNPSPQFPTFMFDDSSTIQPIHSVDPETRTTPADSLTFEEGEGVGPGPNPALFANAVPHEDRSPGDKYAEIIERPDFDSLEWRLANDLDSVLAEYRERGKPVEADHFKAIELEARMESEDPVHKEAAWKDVAAKARRLRASGQVMTQAANPRVITTIVNGDHDVYDCLIVRGNIVEGDSAVTQWSCSCPWGQWAFQREHTFVGRLCSHAYASLMELQSLHKNKSNQDRDRFWNEDSGKTLQFSSLDEDVEASRHPRPDGRLSMEPGTLDMEMNHIPKVRNKRQDKVALFPGTDNTLSEPFAGSGVVEKDSWGTSAQYLEEHPPHLVSMGSIQHEDHVHIPAHEEINAHSIQAGRVFTLAEQAELENEFDGTPYDRSRLDLRGTHYEG